LKAIITDIEQSTLNYLTLQNKSLLKITSTVILSIDYSAFLCDKRTPATLLSSMYKMWSIVWLRTYGLQKTVLLLHLSFMLLILFLIT